MSGTRATIQISDLAAPRLSEAQQAAISHASSQELAFDSHSILRAAREMTGLSDFGPADFRERLDVWIQSIEEDRGLGPFGRSMLYHDCVRLAANRLRVEDVLKQHPEILNRPVSKPILIAGLPRSGTTNLVNMLASDARLRSLPLWEGFEPIPSPGDVIKPGAIDPRKLRTEAVWGQFEALLPHMPAMHEMAPDSISEDVDLMQIDFSSYVLEWLCRAYRWQHWYLKHDRTGSYRYSYKVHQILQWYQPRERWVIKSPQHMENLVPVADTYPDATVVITHRDPVAVIQSIVTMLAYGDRIRRQAIDLKELAEYWINRIEILLRACVRDRDALPNAQSMDVLFHEYMHDTDRTIRQVYELANMELTSTAKSQINRYREENPRGKYGQVAYNFQKDFGVAVGEIRERFSFYYRRFPVELERVPGEST